MAKTTTPGIAGMPQANTGQLGPTPLPTAAPDTSDQQIMKHTSAPNPAPAQADAAATVPTDPKEFQRYLNAQGAKPALKVDGIIGPLTVAAAQRLGVQIPQNLAPTPAQPAPGAPQPQQGGNNQPPAAHTPHTPVATAPADQQSVDDYIRANYGFMAWALDDPELGPILRQGAAEKWDKPTLQGALEKTTVWQTTSDTQRDWRQLAATDPASATRQRSQKTADIANLAATEGVTIAPDRMAQIAEQALSNGWSGQQLQNAVAAEFHYKPGGQTGSIGQAEANLKALAQQYGVTSLLDDNTLASYEQQIAAGTANTDTFKQQFVKLAQDRFPGIAGQITADNPTQNALSPYRNTAAQELGVNPDSIDFTQPRWMRAVNQIDPKTGTAAPMSLYDWTKTLRSDPTYGWDKTPNGIAAGYTAANAIARAFGYMPGG